MYRSLSSTRVADDYNINVGSPSSKSPGLRVCVSNEELPLYDPVSELTKKERSSTKFAENAVHLIPFLLLLCAIILWAFSNPGNTTCYEIISTFLPDLLLSSMNHLPDLLLSSMNYQFLFSMCFLLLITILIIVFYGRKSKTRV